jgi:hypothetical protein
VARSDSKSADNFHKFIYDLLHNIRIGKIALFNRTARAFEESKITIKVLEEEKIKSKVKIEVLEEEKIKAIEESKEEIERIKLEAEREFQQKLEAAKKTGFIYYIKRKTPLTRDPNNRFRYIGSTTNTAEHRFDEHRQTALSELSQPFYRQVFEDGWSNYEVDVVKTHECRYLNDLDLRNEESKEITSYNAQNPGCNWNLKGNSKRSRTQSPHRSSVSTDSRQSSLDDYVEVKNAVPQPINLRDQRLEMISERVQRKFVCDRCAKRRYYATRGNLDSHTKKCHAE